MNASFSINGVIIETERLILRPFKSSDLYDLYEYASVEGVGEMAGWRHHETIEKTQEILDIFIKEDKTFAIVFKGNNKVIGSLGVESFTPVINPPQTAILGVCTITRRIKDEDGEDVSYPAMGLSLTFDHRALDGAPAAKFLKELCFALENFDLLLTK